jgi:hypothetical protein
VHFALLVLLLVKAAECQTLCCCCQCFLIFLMLSLVVTHDTCTATSSYDAVLPGMWVELGD